MVGEEVDGAINGGGQKTSIAEMIKLSSGVCV